MPRTKQNLQTFDPDEGDGLRLIEALADGNPIPDTFAICPDRHRLLALLADISKGERSALASNIAQIAERRGLSSQEIASGAAFLLACLDTPGTDDPYIILGVAPTATSEQIKKIWLSRLTLYHPDRHQEHRDWFTQHTARLNEAYQTLKDPTRRQAYDDRKRRESLAKQRGSQSTIHPFSSVPSSMPLHASSLTRYRTPAIMTAAAVIVVGLVIMSLSGRLPSEPQLYLETAQPLTTTTPPTPSARRPLRARPTRHAGSRRAAAVTPLPTHASWQPPMKRMAHTSLTLDFSASQPDSSHNPTVFEPSTSDRTLVAQALPPIVPEPKALDRREVDALLDEYVEAYEKGDGDRLMATLSQRVREKGSLDYQAIRNTYARGFSGRDQLIYRLKNLQVDIMGEQATVTAQYLISARSAAQSSKMTTLSGRIEWRMQREGDKLKIVSIDY